MTAAALGAALLGGGLVASCSQGSVRDAMLSSTYRPYATSMPKPAAFPIAATSPYQLLAGDLHCHINPPDASDVTRGFAETEKLAKQEGLDFVVLTPHVPSRFHLDEAQRDVVAAGQKALRAEIAASKSGTLFVPGMEYTDHRFGHVGVAFADLDVVLAEVSAKDSKAHPERFFESWVTHGGTLVVNHPLVTPLDSMIISIARADLSWRPWTAKGPFPAEILAVDRLAQGFEAYNIPATTLRDPLLVGRPDVTLLGTLARLDQEIVEGTRRMSPVGGSDSHGHTLRATTFVLAKARTIDAIHDAIVEGRTCIRSPEACSLEARAGEGDAWHPIGSALPKTASLEVRAHGKGIDVIVDGRTVASPDSDEIVKVAPNAAGCSVVRVRVGQGFSAPIYVGCSFSP